MDVKLLLGFTDLDDDRRGRDTEITIRKHVKCT